MWPSLWSGKNDVSLKIWFSGLTRPLKKRWAIYRNFGKYGCSFAVFDVSVPDFSCFLFCIEILNPFLCPSKVPFELNEKPKLFVWFSVKKLVVICLTRTGHCPKAKKKKNTIKTVYHAFVYLGIQTARNKLGKHINCLCTQSEIKVFAISPRRLLGANTLVKRPGYVIYRKGIFSFAGIPSGYAWRNKKNKRGEKTERKHLKQT